MIAFLSLLFPAADVQASSVWHPVTVSFRGPDTSEDADPNPFVEHELTVLFSRGESRFEVPGYFAADGDAAETGATAGHVWRAHFCPPAAGEWRYEATLAGGELTDPSGTFSVSEATDGDGFYSSGPIVVDATVQRYRLAGTGDVWLKAGADSPENLLGYVDFDGTYRHDKENRRTGDTPLSTDVLHRYEPHARDARDGDPTWRGGRGANLLGALNYLSEQGMNSVYFLTMNVTGDGKDVWPWTSHEERARFDCSKLDQWNRVFTHMQRRGLAMHVVLQETENDHLLDGGDLGPERRRYLRELVARFAHHPGLVWNLGEENTQTPAQVAAMAESLRALDPYDHPIKMHTYPNKMEEGYRPLLGTATLTGVSLQVGKPSNTYRQTRQWLSESRESGRPWTAELDEIGPADTGVRPDADDPDHDMVRRDVLWPHLMAGGSGCEWYFGYRFADHDLTAEDWRSRDEMWRQTRVAMNFFRGLPLAEMRRTAATADESVLTFAKPGEVYVLYMKDASKPATLDLSEADGKFTVRWVDAKSGDEPDEGFVRSVDGGDTIELRPPQRHGDWACVVTRP